jgi:hypothetical protein
MVSALKPSLAAALALFALGCVATHHPTVSSAVENHLPRMHRVDGLERDPEITRVLHVDGEPLL